MIPWYLIVSGCLTIMLVLGRFISEKVRILLAAGILGISVLKFGIVVMCGNKLMPIFLILFALC